MTEPPMSKTISGISHVITINRCLTLSSSRGSARYTSRLSGISWLSGLSRASFIRSSDRRGISRGRSLGFRFGKSLFTFVANRGESQRCVKLTLSKVRNDHQLTVYVRTHAEYRECTVFVLLGLVRSSVRLANSHWVDLAVDRRRRGLFYEDGCR